MAQPEYVPLSADDRVRPVERLPVPDGWMADRPAEALGRPAPRGRKLFGTPGPDQGYALRLCRQFEGRLKLTPGELEGDALGGCVPVAMRRAALFGRAPVVYDLELALGLFGFLDDAPADLVAFRKPLFQAAGHDYWDQRAIADLVPEATLRLGPADVRRRSAEWRDLLAV